MRTTAKPIASPNTKWTDKVWVRMNGHYVQVPYSTLFSESTLTPERWLHHNLENALNHKLANQGC